VEAATKAVETTSKETADAVAEQGNDRLHSTDIAFKPNESGWGFSKTYASNYENIFGGGKKK